MITIFAHNFRGFTNTIVDLSDVNFLVGENSTGKTSFMSIAYLLYSEKMVQSGRFCDDNKIDLGYYEDITSTDSFSVGIIQQNKERRKLQGYVLRYFNNNGDPELRYMKYFEDDISVNVHISKGKLSYFIEPISFENYNQDIQKWAESQHNMSDYKDFDLKGLDASKMPISFIPIYLASEVKELKKYSLFFHRESSSYYAPVRAKPQRIYENVTQKYSPEGEHTPSVLNELLKSTTKKAKNLKRQILAFGANTGLFKSLKGHQYGTTKTSPFNIGVEIDKKEYDLVNVGYGVSQALPIVVNLLSDNAGLHLIQQPEVHLHPRAQAGMGEFFFDLARERKMIIETHSDFIINRFRLKQKKSKSMIDSNAQVLYFERVGSVNKIHSIHIDNNGDYSPSQPESFRDFFIKEELDLLSN